MQMTRPEKMGGAEKSVRKKRLAFCALYAVSGGKVGTGITKLKNAGLFCSAGCGLLPGLPPAP